MKVALNIERTGQELARLVFSAGIGIRLSESLLSFLALAEDAPLTSDLRRPPLRQFAVLLSAYTLVPQLLKLHIIGEDTLEDL